MKVIQILAGVLGVCLFAFIGSLLLPIVASIGGAFLLAVSIVIGGAALNYSCLFIHKNVLRLYKKEFPSIVDSFITYENDDVYFTKDKQSIVIESSSNRFEDMSEEQIKAMITNHGERNSLNMLKIEQVKPKYTRNRSALKLSMPQEAMQNEEYCQHEIQRVGDTIDEKHYLLSPREPSGNNEIYYGLYKSKGTGGTAVISRSQRLKGLTEYYENRMHNKQIINNVMRRFWNAVEVEVEESSKDTVTCRFTFEKSS